LAVSAESVPRRYTYPDLATFPDDHLRREIIDGKLIVNPAPVTRHQIVVAAILVALFNYAKSSGGKVLCAPYDVVLAPDNVVEPDVLFIRSDHLDRLGPKYLEGPPDLVVEISSPSTRHLELVRKRELYQRFGVPEYWYVDLETDRVEVYVLEEGRYPAPAIKYAGEALEPGGLPELSVPVTEALGTDR
jgi:Uma2 family endonuclease